ncbi:MAG: CAP domain-containing protein [Methanomicrobiales archaeon]|nr:CAP domain-containing protein [Methanomicrobiales archaeon]
MPGKVQFLIIIGLFATFCIVPTVADVGPVEKIYTLQASQQPIEGVGLSELNCGLIAQYILFKTNNQRISRGLPALAKNAYLTTDALEHSNDMKATGSLHSDVHAGVAAQNVLYTYAGRTLGFPCGGGAHHIGNTENDVATAVVDLWMNHNACAPRYNKDRNNILKASYTKIGVGVVYCRTWHRYWVTENFA